MKHNSMNFNFIIYYEIMKKNEAKTKNVDKMK